MKLSDPYNPCPCVLSLLSRFPTWIPPWMWFLPVNWMIWMLSVRLLWPFPHLDLWISPFFLIIWCLDFPYTCREPCWALMAVGWLVVLNEAHLLQRVGNRGAALPLRLQAGGARRAGSPLWAEGARPPRNFRIPVETGELIPIGPYWVTNGVFECLKCVWLFSWNNNC